MGFRLLSAITYLISAGFAQTGQVGGLREFVSDARYGLLTEREKREAYERLEPRFNDLIAEEQKKFIMLMEAKYARAGEKDLDVLARGVYTAAQAGEPGEEGKAIEPPPPPPGFKLMTVTDLGRLVKAKFPEYSDMDDAELGRRVQRKYPAYRDFVPEVPVGADMTGLPGVDGSKHQIEIDWRRDMYGLVAIGVIGFGLIAWFLLEAWKMAFALRGRLTNTRLDGWQRLAIVAAALWVAGSYALSDDWDEANGRALCAIGILFVPAVARWVKRGF